MEQSKNDIEQLKQLKKDYLSVFSGPAGKKVLEHLKKTCFMYRSTFPSDAKIERLAFNEGQRSVMVHICNMMNFDYETLEKFVKESEGGGWF